MKRIVALLAAMTLALQMGLQPVEAGMSDKDKAAAAAAAIAILGIAALAHNKHHYEEGYEPGGGEETAEFERGYRDGVHGYPYWEGNRTSGYAAGYQAGDRERENSMAHRQQASAAKAPPMAYQGCAQTVARNFAVGTHQVHFTKARSPGKHEWMIEAAVGRQYMTCKMRDSGELIDLRGGRL
ncbi:MAG: hypothetical protein KJ981_16500 [Alphaproteobacteria bacterium]|nr:hypothetical protein [Alphaproteobacteria bacterium]MBU0834234.1 hypothetical protein [Alphaproteobacteria bacterium]MBU1765493.1 hypothetical protein [Alphaproteobacteria bacterium]